MTETMTIHDGLAYSPRMRRAWMPFVALSLLAFGCAEQPRCVDRGTPERPRPEARCNVDKVPVCGDDPNEIYDPASGALRPVPPAGSTCAGEENCRARVDCATGESEPVCSNGATPYCVRGETTTLRPMMPPPSDSGVTPEEDSGVDADAGSSDDAGTDDAGAGDDAGPADSGV